MGAMRTTRILERIGFQTCSPFSKVQANSQRPHPIHLLGSTETNDLPDLAVCIRNQPLRIIKYAFATLTFNPYPKNLKKIMKKIINSYKTKNYFIVQMNYTLSETKNLQN
jgi:hypothetical protein